jgi:hypothetical protein
MNPAPYKQRCAKPGCNLQRDEHHEEQSTCGAIPPSWSGDGPCSGAHHPFVVPYLQPYFEKVPGLGPVAVSRHAQERAKDSGITEKQFEDALFKGDEIPDGMSEVFRDRNGIRVVILLKPEPFRGAVLVKTVFKPKTITVTKGQRQR